MSIVLSGDLAVEKRVQELNARKLQILLPKGKVLQFRRLANFGTCLQVLSSDVNIPGFFTTINPKYECQYMERWQSAKGGAYKMERCYLHICKKAISPYDRPQELVAIHVDPLEAPTERHYVVKRCPHIHFQFAEEPIPRCHFPLEFQQRKVIVSSIENLDKAFYMMMKIIRHQLLDLDIEEAKRSSLSWF